MPRRISALAARRRVMALLAALGTGTAMVAVSPAAPAYADLPPLSCVMYPSGPRVIPAGTQAHTTVSENNVVCTSDVTDILQWETLSLDGSSVRVPKFVFTPNYSLDYAIADADVCLDGRQWTSLSEAWVDWPAPYTDKNTGLPFSYVQSTNSAALACGSGGGGGGGDGGGCVVACQGADGSVDGTAAQDLTGAAVTVTAVAGGG